jgi:hypothetical protein
MNTPRGTSRANRRKDMATFKQLRTYEQATCERDRRASWRPEFKDVLRTLHYKMR